MPLFLLLLAIALVGVVWAVAVGRIRGGLGEPTTTRPYRPLPNGRVAPDDVDDVLFSLGFRGYRMDEVDAVLNRLAAALGDRDDEIEDLRDRLRQQSAEDEPGAGTRPADGGASAGGPPADEPAGGPA